MEETLENFGEVIKNIDIFKKLNPLAYRSLLRIAYGWESDEASKSEKKEMKKLKLMDENDKLYPIVKLVIKAYY